MRIIALLLLLVPVTLQAGTTEWCARFDTNPNTTNWCITGEIHGPGWRNTQAAAQSAIEAKHVENYGTVCDVTSNISWPSARITSGTNSLSSPNAGTYTSIPCEGEPGSPNNVLVSHSFCDEAECTQAEEPPEPEFCEQLASFNEGHVRFNVKDPFNHQLDYEGFYEVNGCEVKLISSSRCWGYAPTSGVSSICTLKGQYTGNPANTEDEPPPLTVETAPDEETPDDEPQLVADNENPVCQVVDGQMVCGPTNHPASCGTINGERTCVAVVDNSCLLYDSGAMSCWGESGLEDDQQQPVTPDLVAAAPSRDPDAPPGTGTVVNNYYGPSTVEGTFSGGGDVVAPGGTRRPGTGGDGTAGTGDLPEGEEGDCPDGVDCDADLLPILDAVQELLNQGFLRDVTDADWSVTPGDCPNPAFEIFGSEYQFDLHCAFIAEYTDLISAMFIIMWLLVGIRIVLSA